LSGLLLTPEHLNFLRQIQYHQLATQCQVQYLHRTVKDFIETEALWKDVILSATPGFDPHLSLLKALTLDITTWDRRTSSAEHLGASICEALCWASAVDPQNHQFAIEILDALDKVVGELERDIKVLRILPSLTLSPGQPHLLPIALRLNMDWWVRHLLSRGCPASPQHPFRPYTFFTVDKIPFVHCPKNLTPPALSKPSLECMRLLVDFGASIYERNEDEMPFWKHVRFEFRAACNKTAYTNLNSDEEQDFEYWSSIVEMLVRLGADTWLLDALFSGRMCGRSWASHFRYKYHGLRERLEGITSAGDTRSCLKGISERQRAIVRLKRRRLKRAVSRREHPPPSETL